MREVPQYDWGDHITFMSSSKGLFSYQLGEEGGRGAQSKFTKSATETRTCAETRPAKR